MRVLLSFFVVAALLAGAIVAKACSCAPPPPPKKALEQAGAVFSGKVTKIEAVGDAEQAVTIEIATTWKGTDKKEAVVITPNDGAACGYEFKKGTSYLIYAHSTKRGEEKALETNICTRNALLADAKEDLKELGEGKKPR